MKTEKETKEQLPGKLAGFHQRVAELEQ